MAEFFTSHHFRSFLEAFNDPVWVVNPGLHLVYMNPAALEKFSLAAVRSVGRLCYQALFENHRPCPFCSLKQVFATGRAVHSTFTLLDTDGRNHVYALANFPCRGAGGQVEYLLAICVDKTEGADQFAEISRLQGLAAMGEYSAELTHEIRNPLNSIEIQMGLLQRMASRLPAATGEPFLKVVEVVRQESRRLNCLAADFLKIQKSRRLDLQECDVFAEVRKVVELVQEEAREAGIALRLEFGDSPALLRADAGKLQQAFLNLVKNAIEALIEAETAGAEIRISGRSGDDRIEVVVSDNGPGIPFARQAKIFDLFYTTKSFGTGIGLHLCRDIIRAHDGELSFVSDENGTVFTVTLPRLESGYE
ncbi:MAG: PAS domain-containing protein [Deltaproteobacteria bacterium]|nr:PAS domain-containing protein [Deltaproteobacteria bacterium]